MKVAVVLDNKVNKWALQRFEPLKKVADITVFVGERNDYDVGSIDLEKRFLTHGEEARLALREPLNAYRRVLRSPYRRTDFYYFSLKRHLDGFDIVYSCDVTRSAYTLACLKDGLGFKLLLAWWENIPYRAVFDDKTSFHKRTVMEKVDMFLPFTETAREVLELEGVPGEKIKVIYPGVDTERFSPGEKPVDLMERNSVPREAFVILYVGKLVSWKGVHNLVYAARLLKTKGYRDFIFVVAGRGAQKENMARLMEETETEEHFRFLDFVPYDRMPDVFRMADMLVLPSYPAMGWQEQFGMVLVEAMATAKPVVSTTSGSIPEVVGDGGVLIPPGDFFSLADAIEGLMNDPEMRSRLGLKGRERVEEVFDSRKSSAALQGVFERVLNGSG